MKSINYLMLFLAPSMVFDASAKKIEKKKPNIVFFLADDCTNFDLACYGSKDANTPNIDALSRDGITFNRCYQAVSMSSPTRHNLYTGIYPVKTGAYPNFTFAYDNVQSVPHYLKPLGYRVALSGKRHIAPLSVFPFEYLDKSPDPTFSKVEGFLKDVKKTKEPFALFLCSHQPHYPWDKGDPSKFDPSKVSLPPFFVDTKETREAFTDYLAEIMYMDNQLGQAVDLIKKYGFDDNTIIIFASEQGNGFPFAKWTCYEAGVKSALIAKFPSTIKAGIKSDAIVEYTDLVPTFIDIAGGEAVDKLDGKSLLPIMKGESNEVKKYAYSLQTTRGIFYGSEHYGIRSIVGERYRYIENLTPEVPFLNIVNNCEDATKEYKWYTSWKEKAKTDLFAQCMIERYKYRPKEELYDVINDKWCLHNLIGDKKYVAIKETLKVKLHEWMKECGDKGEKTELEALEHSNKFKNVSKIKK